LYCSGIDRLTYNHISNSQYGIYIKHSSLNIIVNNIIDGIYLNESNFDYICRNNFIGKNQDKYFLNSYGNIWFRNYWGEPRILPKFIKGEFIGKRVVTWYEFDLRPAIKPFDIE
jgi:parallel beta-helix repeat protein